MSGLSLQMTKRIVPDIQYYLFEAGCKRFNSVALSVEPGQFFQLLPLKGYVKVQYEAALVS